MPVRPLNRDQGFLLPPSLDELVPDDHPARFVAAFVDGLDELGWAELGICVEGEAYGAPAYHPRVLLSVWLYGFMTGVRSCRKLEGACRDQIPYLWLSGFQRPDHNTLWRFYQEQRKAMRTLFKRTVRTAVRLGLVDMALQAVDGTKVAANAAKDRSLGATGLAKLLERTDEAIRSLEAHNEAGEDATPARLPQELRSKAALREQVVAAMTRVEAEGGQVNLTDADATLMKGRQGIVAGYNAQAMVSGLDPKSAGVSGLLVTAADVVTDADDHAQLVGMVLQAEQMTGKRANRSLADGGYHSGANLEACKERGIEVVMPEAQKQALKGPYHKDKFSYESATDSYLCPMGKTLSFVGVKERKGRMAVRVYRANGVVCRSCPAFGVCTKERQGRALEIGPYEALLRTHRAWMATEEAKVAYRKRKELVEPAFGILKEGQGARRMLLRGLGNVRDEWVMLVTAFNLKTLWRVWRGWGQSRRSQWWRPKELAVA